MGAGCWYTLSVDRDERAFWLDVEEPEDYELDLQILNLLLMRMPKVEATADDEVLYYGDCFAIELKPKYYGDGIIIDLVDNMGGYEPHYELMLSKVGQIYRKIIKHINAETPLFIATSGYTACKVGVGEAYT